jgi:uncharacterized protein YcbK (DUF882 family)
VNLTSTYSSNNFVTIFAKFASGQNVKTNTMGARLILPSLAASLAAARRVLKRARRPAGKRVCVAALGLFAVLAPEGLESAAANGDTRTIFLYHAHRKDTIAATFRVNGHYDAETLEKLNWFLRDWRNDEPTKMDPRLFDVVWEAYRSANRLGPDDPIIVMSAYRCPSTNAMLRRRSSAVAEHSQHMLGKAMDTSMPGLSMEKLREIGMRMQRGGVGYYPSAGTPFVHLDVGGVRHWPRMNYDQLARLFPDGKTVHIPSNGKPMDRYEEARAEILARGGEAATFAEASSPGGIFGFFAKIFGGGEDEEEARQMARVTRPTRVASARPSPASDAPPANEQRRMVASAEADLPRGETYMGAPDDSGFGRRAVAAQQPAPQPAFQPAPTQPEPLAQPSRPAPQEAPQQAAEADEAPAVNHPAPPRRPDNLVAALDAPVPPPRPAELARLPDVITRGSSLALRPSGNETAALAYAAPASVAVPLPPPRPALPPLRAAAQSKAEDQRAAKAVASQITPARLDRATLQAMTAPAPQVEARPKNSAGFAPALRSAAKTDALAANAPRRGAQTGFSSKATVLSANSFSQKDDE